MTPTSLQHDLWRLLREAVAGQPEPNEPNPLDDLELLACWEADLLSAAERDRLLDYLSRSPRARRQLREMLESGELTLPGFAPEANDTGAPNDAAAEVGASPVSASEVCASEVDSDSDAPSRSLANESRPSSSRNAPPSRPNLFAGPSGDANAAPRGGAEGRLAAATQRSSARRVLLVAGGLLAASLMLAALVAIPPGQPTVAEARPRLARVTLFEYGFGADGYQSGKSSRAVDAATQGDARGQGLSPELVEAENWLREESTAGFAKAEAAFEAITRAHPDDLNAKLGLGLTLCRLKKWDAALRQFEEVLARAPDHAAALLNAAVVVERRHEFAYNNGEESPEELDRLRREADAYWNRVRQADLKELPGFVQEMAREQLRKVDEASAGFDEIQE